MNNKEFRRHSLRRFIVKGIFSIVLLLFAACKKENMGDCFKSTGDFSTERRIISDFSQLEVRENVYVTLIQDTVVYADVEAGENLIPLIRTDVDNGVLKITNDNVCNWVRSYSKEIHVKVHLKHLIRISHYGSKDIITKNTLTSPLINIDNYNSGDIHASIQAEESLIHLMANAGDVYVQGYSKSSYVFSRSLGFVYAQGLANESCHIAQQGIGDIYVSANTFLGVNITDAGNVYYTGNPILSSTITGSGKLIHQ